MAAELVVDGLSVARAGRRVLSDVSFALRAGDVVAVVGPNGAGKTSLLQAIVGLLRAADGHVTFDVCNFSGTIQDAITDLPVRVITFG